MTVCKFYVNGNCRYGHKCWNEHIDPDTNDYYQRGDYYHVSDNHRSLWRNESSRETSPTRPASNVQFSFNQALQSKGQSDNRFSSLSDDEMDNMYSGDFNSNKWPNLKPQKTNNFPQQNQNTFGRSSFASDTSNKGYHAQNQPSSPHQSKFSWTRNTSNEKDSKSADGLFRPLPSSSPTAAAQNFSFNAAASQQNARKVFQTTEDMVVSMANEGNQFSFQNQSPAPSVSRPSAFAQSTSGMALNSPQSQGSFFGKGMDNVPKGIFGKPSVAKPQSFDGVEMVKTILSDAPWLLKYNNDVHSKLESLSVSEKTAFSNNVFKLGEIPSRPAPLELCR